jgi:hypothetical protein
MEGISQVEGKRKRTRSPRRAGERAARPHAHSHPFEIRRKAVQLCLEEGFPVERVADAVEARRRLIRRNFTRAFGRRLVFFLDMYHGYAIYAIQHGTCRMGERSTRTKPAFEVPVLRDFGLLRLCQGAGFLSWCLAACVH